MNMGLDFVPTEANFILVRVGEATQVYEGLLRKGVIVRDMTPWKLPEHIRVTIRVSKIMRGLLRNSGPF